MKKVKVIRFIPKTVFKAILSAIAIPFAIYFVMAVIGVATGLSANISQSSIITLVYLLFAPIVYGLIFMLLAASYNWLAPKIGGLEVEIEDLDKRQEKEPENQIDMNVR